MSVNKQHAMNSMMKAVPRTLLLIALLMLSCQPIAVDREEEEPVAGRSKVPEVQQKSKVQEKADIEHEFEFENDDLTPDTNIHYTGKYCNECHEETPVEGGKRYLKFNGDYEQLCRCHSDSPSTYIHPVNIEPTPEKKERMPEDYPLENGELTCLSCHDIYKQCQEQLFDRNSLRGAPYSARTDFCYQCHEKKTHEKLNPHHQIDDNGELIIKNCLICHEEKPDEHHATFKDIRLITDIEQLCRRCHQVSGKHSGNADHMGIKPSPEGQKRIDAMEERYNVRLALDENGRMTCITCHNPHQEGVIPEPRPGAKGADTQYRHRLPGNLCKECHQM